MGGKFTDDLEKAQKDLLKNPKDSCAFILKVKALINLSRYSEAYEVLNDYRNYTLNPKQKLRASGLLKLSRDLVSFQKKAQKCSRTCSEFDSEWYKNRILQHIDSEKSKEFQPKGRTSRGCSTVYVLGPPERLSNYRGFEWRAVYFNYEKSHEYPLAQATHEGFIYESKQVKCMMRCSLSSKYRFFDEGYEPFFEVKFPVAKWNTFKNFTKPHSKADVYYSQELVGTTAHNILTKYLDQLAIETKDFFVENYQNIIDPNKCIYQEGGKYKWGATDFVVEEVFKPNILSLCYLQYSCKRAIGKQLPYTLANLVFSYISDDPLNTLSTGKANVASPISNLSLQNTELYYAVESVLSAATPLLAKLRKPALLLPGKLQAVVKAQRIYLQPGQEYEGVWHVDGKNEDIVAVVLYYYRHSEGLEGGDLEFVGKQHRAEPFWVGGDCSPDTFTKEDLESYLEEVSHCKVPVKKGTLVVFSNYQLVHRVLRMSYAPGNTGDQTAPFGLASRDFLALFIVDQRTPLRSNVSSVSGNSSAREEYFLEQLKPSGEFGFGGEVGSTGNGSCALIKFLFEGEREYGDIPTKGYCSREALRNFRMFNVCPPVGRGISWTLDITTDTDEEEIY